MNNATAVLLSTAVSSWHANTSINDSNRGMFSGGHVGNSTVGFPPPFMEGRYSDSQRQDGFVACQAVYFCLLILFTVGNALNLVVLMRSVPEWKTSACHYLIGTAVSDLIAVWLGLPDFLSKPEMSIDFRLTSTKLLRPWFSNTSMGVSDWILVVFSWERLLVISSPFRFRFLQCVLAARVIMVVLFALALSCYAFDVVKAYCFSFSGYMDPVEYVFKPPGWFLPWDAVHYKAIPAVRILTFLLILVPSVILIVFLVCQRRSEFGKMRRLQKVKRAASATTSDNKSQHAINIILLSSALLYLVTRTPTFFDLCATAYANDRDHTAVHTSFPYLDDASVNLFAHPIIDVVTYMGYSLNFYIYLFTERQYRRRFIELVARPLCCPCFPALALITSTSESSDNRRTEEVQMDTRRPLDTMRSQTFQCETNMNFNNF
ncbi:uncharacterized protein LOC129594026 [Paramacrobiotus metropolitanus]|uniref:uncharacterized protein LOC129594026 n=1 Tax=Paramacrobiotus metropolitanus TaxID=2943436 RepID=UPI0024465D4F|nr:uncharacterized protein LOC129594026 [Paramacrobiotus metropolitanus]